MPAEVNTELLRRLVLIFLVFEETFPRTFGLEQTFLEYQRGDIDAIIVVAAV